MERRETTHNKVVVPLLCGYFPPHYCLEIMRTWSRFNSCWSHRAESRVWQGWDGCCPPGVMGINKDQTCYLQAFDEWQVKVDAIRILLLVYIHASHVSPKPNCRHFMSLHCQAGILQDQIHDMNTMPPCDHVLTPCASALHWLWIYQNQDELPCRWSLSLPTSNPQGQKCQFQLIHRACFINGVQ